MINEFETKCLITKKNFDYLINYYQLTNYLINENYYFETPKNYFKNNDSALRIRRNQQLCELTLKTKHLTKNTEQNYTITHEQFQELKNLQLATIHQKFPLFNKFDTLTITGFTTHRYHINFEDHLIELDHTFINHYNDYEIEIESKDLTTAQLIMRKFLTHHNIKYQQSEPKIARIKKYNQ